MRPLSAEWVNKAESDWRTADEMRIAKHLNFDLICFLAQQTAEKYLKACLQELDVEYPKTHDLNLLLELFPSPVPRLTAMADALREMSSLAVDVRYPGFSAGPNHADRAMTYAADVRSICRNLLNLKS